MATKVGGEWQIDPMPQDLKIEDMGMILFNLSNWEETMNLKNVIVMVF